MTAQESLLAWADFNSRDPEGLLTTFPEWVSGFRLPEPGTLVTLYDDDGNTCGGTVVRIEGDLIKVRPDWRTWHSSSMAYSTTPVVDLSDEVSVVRSSSVHLGLAA